MTNRFWNRYHAELGGALILYALVLAASLRFLSDDAITQPWLRILVTLAPMVPCGLGCWAILRQMRRVDEFHVRVQFEAIGFAFAATALLSLGYGFLENVGLPRLSLFVVWPVMAACWILGGLISARRYR